LSFYTWLCWYS